jgi:hypothetical protein
MTLDRDQQIIDLVARLTNEVSVARENSLDHAADLLQMAKLELQLILHQISGEELRALTAELTRDRLRIVN